MEQNYLLDVRQCFMVMIKLMEYLFTSIDYGGSGYIVFGIVHSVLSPAYNSPSSVYITTPPFGSANIFYATLIQRASLTQTHSTLWGVQIPSGTTGSVVVQFPGGVANCQLGVWRVQNLVSTTPVNSFTASSSTNVVSGTLTGLTTNGIIISNAANNSNVSYTWTNITENYDGALDANIYGSGASRQSPSGSLTISATTATPFSGSENILNTISLR